MTETPDVPRPDSDESGDLSYDLSHEATANLRHPGKRRHAAQHLIELPDYGVGVGAPPPWPGGADGGHRGSGGYGDSGDYGYDLARDVPRRT